MSEFPVQESVQVFKFEIPSYLASKLPDRINIILRQIDFINKPPEENTNFRFFADIELLGEDIYFPADNRACFKTFKQVSQFFKEAKEQLLLHNRRMPEDYEVYFNVSLILPSGKIEAIDDWMVKTMLEQTNDD
jgi:hypothetical protein